MSDPRPLPPARLHFILATDARVGVVLRRGPTRWVRLYRWDTETDTFTPGQWFKGRIYEKRCDLSPDGALFAYFARKHTYETICQTGQFLNELDRKKQDKTTTYYTCAWTAVSRPPWFTALALWPKGDSWAGGGVFETNRDLWLNHSPGLDRPHVDHRPKRLRVQPLRGAHGEDRPIIDRRLRRHGWTRRQEWAGSHDHGKGGYWTDRPEVWAKDRRRGDRTLVMEGSIRGYEWRDRFQVVADGHEPISLGRASWADWDQRGRLVYVSAGRVMAGEFQDGALVETVLADLNDATPRAIRAPPSARHW